MVAIRMAALLVLVAGSVQAQTIVRYAPDEMLSRYLPASGPVYYPSISDDGRRVAMQAPHPIQSFWNVIYLVDRQDPTNPARVGTDCDAGLDCELQRPRISGNGQFVIFDSQHPFAGGSATDTQGDRDVFVWDRISGATSRVSVAVSGTEPNDASFAGDISRDGRYVAFMSYATNLVTTPSLSGTPRNLRSYWKDRQTGLVKLVYEGAIPLNQEYPQARITSNGRYVMAVKGSIGGATFAINWDALNGTTGFRIDDYWTDRNTFAMTPDRRFVAGVGHPFADGSSSVRVLRVDSQQVATPIISNEVGPSVRGLDLSSGAGWLVLDGCPVSFTGASVRRVEFYGADGRVAKVYLNNSDFCPANTGIDMTPDGRYAVVASRDVSPPGPDAFDFDNDGNEDVFLIENPLWQPLPKNLVADFSAVPANSRNVKVSADGRLAVFESDIAASEFGAYADTNGSADIFRFIADFQQIELLSTDNGVAAFAGGARNPAMSGDGHNVVFEAVDSGITASNLSDGKLSARVGYKASTTAVFLRRLVQNQLQRVSTSRTGGSANGSSMNASISSDGRRVAFATDASNVNPVADPNGLRDVVAVQLDSGVRQCVSSCGAVVADGPSDHPAISNAGIVAFESSASAVQRAAGLPKASIFSQIVLRSVVTGASQVASRSSGGQPGNGSSTRPTVSSSGQVVAYQSSASNLDASGSDNRVNVIRYATGRGNQRISRSGGPNGKATAPPANGDSVNPALSGDGRFLAFQTSATNLAGFDANGVTDLMVHDGRGDALRRLADGFGGLEPNGASETPHLNLNGTRVGFHSFATNLDAEAEGVAASATSSPYASLNPLGADIVFADAFE